MKIESLEVMETHPKVGQKVKGFDGVDKYEDESFGSYGDF